MADINEIPPDYEIVLEPNARWFRLDLRSLYEFRDLLFLLVRRDFVVKYKQTLLGPAWFVLQPLLMTIVFTVIFGRVAQLPTDELPPILFYLSGLVAWTYLAQTINGASTTFTTNASLFDKVYFPRIIVPVSVVISNLFAFALQFLTFLGFFVYFKFFTAAGPLIQVHWTVVFLPLLVLHTSLLALGVSLWMSAVTAKYRDLAQLTQFLTQLWMFATPVIVPLSVFGRYQWIAYVNPMTPVVEFFRFIMLGAGTTDYGALATSAVVMVLLFLTGMLVFQKTARRVMDTV